MANRLDLRCLGTPVLLGSDGEPIRFRTRKHFGLLVFMAVEGNQSHRRQRLAELLWPRVAEAEARHSVATAISMFRNRLGPRSIVADRDNVRLTLPELTIDLTRLLAGKILGDDVTPTLEIANFLEDFELGDAPEFMLWRTRQQARLFPAIRDGLLLLIDRCRRTGNFRQIEVLADRLLDIDHLSEDGIRAKMEARAFDGDRLSALRIYEDWRTILAQELGATPSAQVQGIALRLRRRGWERTEAAEIPNVPTDHWKGARFIARANEYRAVYEAWEETAQGKARNILLLGDSGVGKTTISDRVITAAGLEGAATIRIQCYELDRGIPYAALSGLVRGLLDRPGATGTPPAALANLSVCNPEILRRYADLPAPGASDGEGTRIQLAEATQELLAAVADERPVILVVDDLHLADDASVSVLHLILRRLTAQPVMMLFAARPGELERSPSARRIREGAEGLMIRIVDVPPMPPEESQDLLAALLEGASQAPSSAEQRTLLRAAAGYPMVLELFVQDWLANGSGATPLRLGAMTEDLASAKAAENAYKTLIDRMIHELPSTVRGVLNLAAILGNRLNDLEMYALVDSTLANTMTAMTALNDLRLFRDNGREIGFRNELIRAQAYMNVPSTLRKALHGLVLDRLLAGQSEPKPTGLELAWHSFRAGRLEEGPRYLLEGAREAIDDGGVCEAELALRSGMGSLSPERRGGAQLLLAESLQDQGRWIDSIEVLEGTDEALRAEVRKLRRVHLVLAKYKAAVLERDEEEDALTELTSYVTASESKMLRERAVRVCFTILSSSRYRRASLSLLKAISILLDEGVEQDETEFLVLESLALAHFGQIPLDTKMIPTAVEHAEKRRPYAKLSHDESIRYMIVGSLRVYTGDYLGALPDYQHAFETANRLGNTHLLSRAAGNISMCHYRLGDNSQSSKWAQIGLSAPNSQNDLNYFRLVHLQAWAEAIQGEPERALSTLQLLEGELRFKSFEWAQQASFLLTSDVMLLLGRRRDSLRAARDATSGRLEALMTRSYAGPFARALSSLGVSDGSETIQLHRIDEMLRQHGAPEAVDLAEISCARGRLKNRLGLDDADEMAGLEVWLGKLPTAVRTTLEILYDRQFTKSPGSLTS